MDKKEIGFMTTKNIPARSEVPAPYKWDIEDIFKDEQTWRDAYQRLEDALPEIEQFKGHLGDSPEKLFQFFQLFEKFRQLLSKVYIYAGLNFAVETFNQNYAALKDMAGGLVARALSAVAFEEPELMAIGFDKLRQWTKEHPDLKLYEHYFEKLERNAAHIRSAEIEQLLGQVSDPFGTASGTHSILVNADLPFKPAVSSTGETFEVTHSSMSRLSSHPDREVRRTAFENYADAHLAFKNTMANCLSAGIKQDVFMANARRYSTTVEASLSASYLPVDVYYNAINTYRKNVSVWHRYWKVRKQALKLDRMHVYDTRAVLTGKMPEISYEQAVEWVMAGLQPMGKDYAEIVRKGTLEQRWVDIYPNKGKSFGAFSAGYKGTKPLIMLNFDNSIFSLSTLAHELGHSMHSYLTWENQPLAYSDYNLFVAEVASNFHQAMVRDHLLKIQTDRDFQVAIIEEAMANFFRYFFIMPSLSIFDLEIHQRAERGEPLTFEGMTNLLADIFEEGYGPDVEVDRDRVGSIWMQFSTHLYSNYYTYQYTTGISAAHALAEAVVSGEQKARDNYLAFLKSGDSLFPLDALKLAGVDMTTPAPIEKTFQVLERYIDKLEKLLG
jgi:oligoendopeptidase F